jgi:hypothetical protein
MRSIFVHLRDASESEVAAFLQETYPFQQGPVWISEVVGDACLYIDFFRPDQDGGVPSEWDDIARDFGEVPTVNVIADVSGRHPGDEQIRGLVTALLARFNGAATDGYTCHMWSLDEIVSGHRVEGHPFFDYNGWYRDRNSS